MRALILPPEEWGRLEAARFPPLLPHVDPDNVAVVVVEEKDDVVACVTVMRVTHFEGLWIHPFYRGNAGVARALLRLATAIPQVRGEKWVFGGIENEQMRGFIGRLGGVQIPVELYALWVGKQEGGQEWPSHQ